MHSWLADRTSRFDASGIRRVFELARKLKDPINLSIGQPDFDVPDVVKDAGIEAVNSGKNGYAPSSGLVELREKLQARIEAEYGQADRQVFVTSGTSGGLTLAIMALVNPGDEVIVFDPFFVSYKPLVELVDGRCVFIDTYPDFRIDLAKVRAAITLRTKAIFLNSPANPTGVVATEAEVRGIAQIAAEKNIALVSDEIYRSFCYEPFTSPVQFNPHTLVIDGFSKSHAMTGWRLGFVHGPSAIIDAMIKLQQYTFVCAPQPAQWAGIAAMEVEMTAHVEAYRRKRDLLMAGLAEHYQVVRPGGAFYVFPKVPTGTGADFVNRAIENSLLVIPGGIFSRQDTHFRISYAASDETIRRGIEVLRKMAG